ncbi:MAG: ArgE/DapE family deacylase [Anaerolineales bacterium]|nr:ArgE/DapE family deacylase [Anaerolineales bacterium]
MIDQNYLLEVLARMVQIDSRNPDLTDGAPGEAEIGAYVAGLMVELGLEVETETLGEKRVNVVGIWRGTGNGRSLMLNGHLDTVGVEGMAEPYSGAVRDGKLYGRGSYDMKGSLAAMLAATKALKEQGVALAGDLLLTAVADEEYASIGTEAIARRFTADAAIVTEPTHMEIVCAHRGFVWYDVTVTGRAAHGSLYDVGIDANMRMGRFLAELEKLEIVLRTERPLHPLTGYPSLHAATLHGGSGLSTYADRCTLQIERRLNPGETEAQATAELQAIIDRLVAADPTFRATVTPLFSRTPLEAPADAPIVKLVDKVVSQKLGRPAAYAGMRGWTDAAILSDAGIDSLLLGPSGEGAHAAEEWVDTQSLLDFAEMLVTIVAEFCG